MIDLTADAAQETIQESPDLPKMTRDKIKAKSLKKAKAHQKMCQAAIPIIDSNSSVFLGRRNSNPTKAQWSRPKMPFVTGPKMEDTTTFRAICQGMKVTQRNPSLGHQVMRKYPKSDLLGDKETHVFEIRLMHDLDSTQSRIE